MKILNLTQHKATEDQLYAGVIDLDELDRNTVRILLTFNEPPVRFDMVNRAEALAAFARQKAFSAVMINGAPFFMSELEKELKKSGFFVLYSFSVRENVETTAPDGKVEKKAIFKHAGWVQA